MSDRAKRDSRVSWRDIGPIDPSLIQFLESAFPFTCPGLPPESTEGMAETLMIQVARQNGRQEVIRLLQSVLNRQKQKAREPNVCTLQDSQDQASKGDP